MNKTKSANYERLREEINTKEKAFTLSECTFLPHVAIERAKNLTVLFAENYLETEEDRDRLVFEVKSRPEIVGTFIFTVIDLLCDVNQMLRECQDFMQGEE